ncbi:hypothetical protein J6590_050888 [Homalodisca vitripennis]|nr:hypothetical protein J6590_050888 [Homalodisca vitripennis]
MGEVGGSGLLEGEARSESSAPVKEGMEWHVLMYRLAKTFDTRESRQLRHLPHLGSTGRYKPARSEPSWDKRKPYALHWVEQSEVVWLNEQSCGGCERTSN